MKTLGICFICCSKDLHIDGRRHTRNISASSGGGLIRSKATPKLIDLNELIESKVKHFTDDSFIYLTYMVSTKSEYFTAYALHEVPFQGVDRRHFYTVSRRGVTFFSGMENHFTPLASWQHEYRHYTQLMKIKTFATFRLWKGFTVWYKGLVWRKFAANRKFLQENLFAAIVPLGRALLVLRNEYYRFMVLSFVDVTQRENQHLFYFIEAQMLTYELARDALLEYRRMMTGVLCEWKRKQKRMNVFSITISFSYYRFLCCRRCMPYSDRCQGLLAIR